MSIVEISPFKGNTMCIVLESGRRLYINKGIVTSHRLAVGSPIDDDYADSLERENDLRRAKERALYLLEGRDYSREELYRKLKASYAEDIADSVCDMVSELHLINDRKYAEKLCKHLSEVKCYGKYRIKQELCRRGIDKELAGEVMEEFLSEDDDSFERLEHLVEVKYERYLTDRKGVEKVKNALLRRGYSYGEIREVLDLYDLDFDD